jgi:hypothetical protein
MVLLQPILMILLNPRQPEVFSGQQELGTNFAVYDSEYAWG